ncbi:cysteine desulfurase family protein [Paenibacillus sp. J22TS3]|uniref:cysteine desulfurase family protein n=1 Tax=Paenibacillus sp. J22TS3 TaxID=2807192 RepID=UPI001B1EE844|nr:cysteine desulfurase family protein [Paenibacillus sp. J22TS3]GIP20511.1 aminotransferase V [Paenibacillus sp. J22TS3]
MYYFDHAAATPPSEEVIRTVYEVMKAHYGNPSSLHQPGLEGGKLLRRAREVCAASLGVQPREVIFTSGATESNNLALKGAALQYRSRGKHIITTEIEHPSVYESAKQLETLGFDVTFLPVSHDGTVTAKQVLEAVRPDTILVSVMHVNNETGSIQPIQEIGRALQSTRPKVLFHVDGVQGYGKVPLSLQSCGIDLYSLSAHKIRGPKGVGLLYIKDGVSLFPLLSGGGQERGLRAGTENVPLIVGMAKAVRMAGEHIEARAKQLRHLREQLVSGIQQIPELVLNSPVQGGAPHIVSFSYPGMKAEALLHMLEEAGFMVSTKSACSSKSAEPSRVLLAMGAGEAAATSGIRISFGEEHTAHHIQLLIDALTSAVSRLKAVKGGF